MFSVLVKLQQKYMWHQLFLLFVVFITPIVPAMLVTGFLITVDFLTGIYASMRQKKKITSRRLRDTIDKVFVYNITIIVAFLIEKYMIDGAIPLFRVVLGFISLAEVKSISENFNKITGINLYKKGIAYLKKKHDIEV